MFKKYLTYFIVCACGFVLFGCSTAAFTTKQKDQAPLPKIVDQIHVVVMPSNLGHPVHHAALKTAVQTEFKAAFLAQDLTAEVIFEYIYLPSNVIGASPSRQNCTQTKTNLCLFLTIAGYENKVTTYRGGRLAAPLPGRYGGITANPPAVGANNDLAYASEIETGKVNWRANLLTINRDTVNSSIGSTTTITSKSIWMAESGHYDFSSKSFDRDGYVSSVKSLANELIRHMLTDGLITKK